MRLSQSGLILLLSQNVVELRFKRRHAKTGWNAYRRMLCTNDLVLLNSVPGKIALHYKQPTQPPSYDWMSRNLVCAWDIFWQEFRMIPVETCDVITVMTTELPERFWDYFAVYLTNLSPQEKMEFMNI